MHNTDPASDLPFPIDYPLLAKLEVAKTYNLFVASIEGNDFITTDEVFVVWFAKTLKNWKALCSTTVEDGRYYELTYNGEKNELYIDIYVKESNTKVDYSRVHFSDDMTETWDGDGARQITHFKAGKPIQSQGEFDLAIVGETSSGSIASDLAGMLNSYCAENVSGTPDFVLAEFMLTCLKGFNEAVHKRAGFRGEFTDFRPTHND